MKNSRGITLASLVVMIASIILLSTMAIGFGYRYLEKTKEVFWDKVNQVGKQENMDGVLAYLFVIMQKAKQKNINMYNNSFDFNRINCRRNICI